MAKGHGSGNEPATRQPQFPSIGGGRGATQAPPLKARPWHVTVARGAGRAAPSPLVLLTRRSQNGRLLASLALLNEESFIVPFGRECSCPLWRCQ